MGAEQRPTAVRRLQEPRGNLGHTALAGQTWGLGGGSWGGVED